MLISAKQQQWIINRRKLQAIRNAIRIPRRLKNIECSGGDERCTSQELTALISLHQRTPRDFPSSETESREINNLFNIPTGEPRMLVRSNNPNSILLHANKARVKYANNLSGEPPQLI